jgi:hypothetical protein
MTRKSLKSGIVHGAHVSLKNKSAKNIKRKSTFERDVDLLLFFLPLDLDLEREDDELDDDRERLRRRRRRRSAERLRDLDRDLDRLRLSRLRLLDFTERLLSRLRSGEDFFSDFGISFRTDFLIFSAMCGATMSSSRLFRGD